MKKTLTIVAAVALVAVIAVVALGVSLGGVTGARNAAENERDALQVQVNDLTARLTELEGNATLRTYIIDAIYRMTPERLDAGAKFEER